MKRISSIDILRSLTMFLMLWVNDFASMEGIPDWMCHAPGNVDMLGLSDLAFPSFLFCMGLSIPFAIESRYSKGEGVLNTLGHILLRSLSLILLGLMELNQGGNWYILLLGVAIFLIWNNYPKSTNKWLRLALTTIGIVTIICLAQSVWPMHTGWWGILGLIGWSYLLCSVLYLSLRRLRYGVVSVWPILIAILILSKSGLHFIPSYPGGWVHTCLAFTGVAVSSISMSLSKSGRGNAFPLFALAGAVLMTASFIVCHKFWIVSKIMGTPTWMFLSLAIDMAFLALIHHVADIKGHTAWATPIRAAGVATFTCYCLPFIIDPLIDILGIRLPDNIRSGFPGLILAFAFAICVILIAELLSKVKIRLKL